MVTKTSQLEVFAYTVEKRILFKTASASPLLRH